MKTAVIVDSVRTGLAKSFRGGFNMTRPDEMLAHIINATLERNPNLPPEAVEDIIMGCGNPEGAQGHNVGRNAAVLSNVAFIICASISSGLVILNPPLNDLASPVLTLSTITAVFIIYSKIYSIILIYHPVLLKLYTTWELYRYYFL